MIQRWIKGYAWLFPVAGDWEPFDLLSRETMTRLLHSQVFRHMFTGPSSAVWKIRKAKKDCKAQIHGMTEMTGRNNIACASVHVRLISVRYCSTEGSISPPGSPRTQLLSNRLFKMAHLTWKPFMIIFNI
ncbi:hypothetical protein BC827DRAFT_268392 [Russula dissimulans]|nr:hypothetical protein BC827DRAFT_268392 [Russula dissimulans]